MASPHEPARHPASPAIPRAEHAVRGGEPTRTLPMAHLKHATADCHRQIESQLRIAERFGSPGRYLAHVEALAAFHRTTEDAWEPVLTLALRDYPERRKATLLEEDVRVLGGHVPNGAPLPLRCDRAWALGGFYVLEGASLGGAILLELARRNLGLDAHRGARYLASHGEALPRMWRCFGEQLNAQLAQEEDLAVAVAGARSTFALLEHWLCGGTGP